MKITMLGTGAIGYPLGFCNCENCKEARKLGGKNIRKRASILINDDLLIDLGPDVQTSMTMYNKDMSKIKYWLQTHTHTDHFDEEILSTRLQYNIDKKQNNLELIAHPNAIKIINKKLNEICKCDITTKNGQKKLKLHCNYLNDGNEIVLGNYKIKAIYTNHDLENGSILYLITQDNKSIFYATDTNKLTAKSLKQLKDTKIDLVIMDHNFGNVNYSYKHLNEARFIKQINTLKKLNIIDDNTKIYATHISHEGNKCFDEAEKRAIKNGYHISYDGMEISI